MRWAGLLPFVVVLLAGSVGGRAEGRSPLQAAAAAGDLDRVRALLADGADANAVDERGSTALHLAAAVGGARTPAACKNRRAIVEALLANGAEVNAADADGMTALHIALARERDEIIGVLVDAGADLHAAAKNGRTPMHFAALAGNVKAIDLLAKRKAEVNVSDKLGSTPLHVAAMRPRVAAVERLLALGGEVDAVDSQKQTALHVLAGQQIRATDAEAQLVEAAKLLLEHGADVNARAADGTTALGRAADRGYERLAELLEREGGVK